MTTVRVRNIHEQWKPNEQAVFDYSLDPDDLDSEIARLIGHRTGQIVTVLDEQDPDHNRAEFPTFAERGEAGAVVCYGIRFPGRPGVHGFRGRTARPRPALHQRGGVMSLKLRLFMPVDVHLGQPMVMTLEPLAPGFDCTLRVTSPVTCVIDRRDRI